ncbi:MAG TPA: CYTH domain-containing protein, partial [Bacilli bacterium]|nr:CYTH domain-containing protein [Bacilli bacterium]
MDTEYEIRILEINKDEFIKKIVSLGAIHIGDFEQKRYVYDLIPEQESKWIRLRTNGKETTLTIKEIKSKTIDGTKELEIVVSDFEKTNSVLEQLGFKNKGYQENRRSEYILD